MGGMLSETNLTSDRYPDSINKNSVEEANIFQDVVMLTLYRSGIVVQPFSSKKYQIEKGESIQGIEIKLDNWCTRSGRLSIEYEEKSRASIATWTKSGIYRCDNTIFYVQGNSDRFWLFHKKILIHIYETRKVSGNPFEEHVEPKDNPTIKAFYLPENLADKYGSRFEVRPT